MSNYPKSVFISEEGPREGFQIEKTFIPTERKIELIDALSKTGVKEVQTVSFVNPKLVPNMADALEVVKGIDVQPDVHYTAIWFNDKGLEKARETNRLTLEGKIRMFASDAFLANNLKRTPQEHLAQTHAEIENFKRQMVPIERLSIVAAFGCNFEGAIAPAKVLELVKQGVEIAEEHEVHPEVLSLADTMAWATPDKVKYLVGAIQDKYPKLRISLHLHDTRGMGVANAYAGLSMGVDMFDASVGGLGGCPFAAHKGAAGNLCTEDFIFLCQELGIETGIDLEALIDCANLAEDIVGHPLPGSIMKGGTTAAITARNAANLGRS